MVKLIGLLLIISSVVSFIAGGFIDVNYGSHTYVTGNAIENIMTQPAIPMWGYDYLSGAAISYSIVSFILGAVFLFRV